MFIDFFAIVISQEKKKASTVYIYGLRVLKIAIATKHVGVMLCKKEDNCFKVGYFLFYLGTVLA